MAPIPDATIDTSGLFCPLPIIRTAEKVREIAIGAVLQVIATDFGILQDMPAWCTATGNEYLGTTESGAEYHCYVRRLR
jgi:TusA-related sulfurtransferase